MYNILTLNNISKKGLNLFGADYNCSSDIKLPDAILVRSQSMHEMPFDNSILAVARAGAGINNIPVEKCSENGTVVFNTPGANANAVKELVLVGLLLSSRKIYNGIKWVESLKGQNELVGKMVEKGKSSFAGPELKGKKLGVIGLGAIGVLVANAALCLGMEVFGYDPYISIDSAWGLSSKVKHSFSMEKIFSNCDYITMHVPLSPDTENMINSESIRLMKNGVRILNFSRGGLVSNKDIVDAVKSGKVMSYVTDFPSYDLIGVDGIIAIPHLGASTPESEENCSVMAVNQLKDYLENGNIVNSVNMPNISMARDGGTRVCVLHKNIPNIISSVSGVLSSNSVNIENMSSKSRNAYAYAILDVTGDVFEDIIRKIYNIDGVIRTRIII